MSERAPLFGRTISHPERINYPQGIALLIITHSTGQILLVQETGDDPRYGRRKDQWNVPTGTRRPGELPRYTIGRELVEELGVGLSSFSVIQGSYTETTGEYERIMGYPYRFRGLALLYTDTRPFRCFDGEVKNHQWVSPQFLDRYDLETGAKLFIAHYFRLPALQKYLSHRPPA